MDNGTYIDLENILLREVIGKLPYFRELNTIYEKYITGNEKENLELEDDILNAVRVSTERGFKAGFKTAASLLSGSFSVDINNI